jgi:hypothetical protein
MHTPAVNVWSMIRTGGRAHEHEHGDVHDVP